MTDIIAEVRRFTEGVGCTTDRFNVRQTALYEALVLEESAECIEAMLTEDTAFNQDENYAGLHQLVSMMRYYSDKFKSGELDRFIVGADREQLLDGAIDRLWVTIGSALSQGADVEGAAGEVARANLSKLVMCDDCYGTKTVNRFDHESGTEYQISDCAACNGTGLVAMKDENGKVIKPYNFVPPDVSPFVCKN